MLEFQVERGLWESPIGQVLVEESVRGWDEFELELMRDRADNVVVVCSIENLDPMGVHTGDSVTVAPQMTLSDEAYQELRDAAAAVIRAVGVETGGSNIQFARDRETGALRVIEMNPRVSRSSALASKATGYPIAKVAAKLAVGYTLDEIPNDLTRTTPASFEPTLDYVVVKFPRFAFEKFPGADQTLGTQMKSVGEAMGIGRTFSEAFLKAHGSRELEHGSPTPWASLLEDDIPDGLHPWFEEQLANARLALESGDLARAKRAGWGDDTIGVARGLSGAEVRRLRHERGVRPAFRRVDSCAGEVEAASNYFYSTWGEEDEALPASDKPRVVILGSGPNRIGQGIEFDYCCVHAAKTFRELGYEAVMVNCNPETVSTDYDTSDRLYFEPLSRRRSSRSAIASSPSASSRSSAVRLHCASRVTSRRAATGSSARLTRRSIWPRIASASARSPAISGCGARRGPPSRASTRRSQRSTRSSTPFSCGRRTCSAVARCGSATTPSSSPPRWPRFTVRCSSIASSSTRPSSTSTRSATATRSTSPRSCSTSKRPACTPATPPASFRRRR